MTTQFTGQLGEFYAEQFLAHQGYKIIAKNYRCREGELDLIAFDYPTLVFVEVKARKSDTYGEPQESVNYFKKQKLLKAIFQFLKTCPLKFSGWRLDVLAVKLEKSGKLKNIFHFKDILNN